MTDNINMAWVGEALNRLIEDVADIKSALRDMDGSVRRNVTDIAVHGQRWASYNGLQRREASSLWGAMFVSGMLGGVIGGLLVHWLGG